MRVPFPRVQFPTVIFYVLLLHYGIQPVGNFEISVMDNH